MQRAGHHLEGSGCPICTTNVSKVEIEWLDYLKVPKKFRQKTIMINGKQFRVDAFDELNKNIYEFYGDYWHGNPLIFKPTYINKHNKKLFGELYSATLKRESYLKECGYYLFTIWESDWKEIKKNYSKN